MIKRHFTKILSIILGLFALMNFDATLFLLAFLFGWFLFGTAVSITMHRYLSHRAFHFRNDYIKYFFYLTGILSGQGSPVGWVGLHRLHHMDPDGPDDPQSIFTVGKLKTAFSWYNLEKPNLRLMVDVLKDKQLMFIHNRHQYMFALYALCLYIIDPLYCFYFAGLAPLVCLSISGFINTYGHGATEHVDGGHAKNMPNILLTILCWGENFHRNHHLHGSKLNLGPYDLGYYLTRLVKKH